MAPPPWLFDVATNWDKERRADVFATLVLTQSGASLDLMAPNMVLQGAVLAMEVHEIADSVIDMARAEGPRSANPDAFLNRLLSKLFGIATPRPFANERLERLRRFALSAWFCAEIRTRDLRALFKAGFSSNDAARIIAYVGLHRGSVPEVEGWP